MSQKPFSIKPGSNIAKCPECGNNTSFVAHSVQCAEDCCDVWVKCVCGYDPTEGDNWKHRMEDVWGCLDQDTIGTALHWSWHEPLTASD